MLAINPTQLNLTHPRYKSNEHFHLLYIAFIHDKTSFDGEFFIWIFRNFGYDWHNWNNDPSGETPGRALNLYHLWEAAG